MEQQRMRSKSPGDARSFNSSVGTSATSAALSSSTLAIVGSSGSSQKNENTNSLHSLANRRGGERSKRRSIEDWEINHDKVVFKEQIGAGSFGTVFKAIYFGIVAVKKLNISNPGPELLLAFKNEVTVLKKARHGNVLNFLGVIREPELAIVTQWCQGSSLYKNLVSLHDGSIILL